MIDSEYGRVAYPVEQRNSVLYLVLLCRDYDYAPCGLLVDPPVVVVDSPGASEALR